MPTVISKKVLINMMARFLDLNIVTSANHNGQLFDEWDILNGHLYHFDSTPMTFTAPNGQKVTTQTLPLQQLTKPLLIAV